MGVFRFTIAALGFLLLARLRKYDLRTPFREDRNCFLLGGLLGVFMNQVIFLWGLKLTLPAHAALLYALTPKVVLILGCLRGAERPSLRKVSGIVLAFSGVLALFSGGRSATLPPRWMLGDFLVLLAVLSWAGYTMISSDLVRKYGSDRTTALTIFVGFMLFPPLGCIGLTQFHPSHIPSAAWVGAFYSGVVGSVAMYLLWFHALSPREPSRVTIAANGQPNLTALAGWAFFGQAVTPLFRLGAALLLSQV